MIGPALALIGRVPRVARALAWLAAAALMLGAAAGLLFAAHRADGNRRAEVEHLRAANAALAARVTAEQQTRRQMQDHLSQLRADQARADANRAFVKEQADAAPETADCALPDWFRDLDRRLRGTAAPNGRVQPAPGQAGRDPARTP